MSTVTDLISDAMRLAGIRRYAGRTPSTDELTEAQRLLNRMISSWNNLRLMAPSVNRVVYDIGTPLRETYTLGPDGDWNGPRPVRIERARLIWLNNPAQPNEIPLKMFDDKEWADVRVKTIESPIPIGIYDDRSFPTTGIHFWPIPNQAAQIALYVWQQVAAFANLDDQIDLAPGYEDAIMYNLAVRLHQFWSHGEKTPLDPNVAAEASNLKRLLGVINAPSPQMKSDVPGPSSGSGGAAWDWRTGEIRR